MSNIFIYVWLSYLHQFKDIFLCFILLDVDATVIHLYSICWVLFMFMYNIQ